MTQGINSAPVTAWLAEHVPVLVPPLNFELIAGGHSNLTYRIDDSDGNTYVLRRPPLGQVLQSAHDMAREYRIVSALAGSAVPVATTYGLCSDANINDAPFFVMGFVDGAVLHDIAAAEALRPEQRLALGRHVIEVLVALHAIEPADVGLADLGRHEAYIARQLKRWTRQWEATITEPIAAMETSRRLLDEQIPQQHGATIVHGDYRLGNFITGDGQLRAVLDWELCTLGDPLADVGYLLNSWVSPGDAIEGVDDHLPTLAGGFPERGVLIERYAALSGRDLSHINYYRAFSYWRIAAIRQGVYKRYLEGAMGEQDDFDLERIRVSVQRCAEAAAELLTP